LFEIPNGRAIRHFSRCETPDINSDQKILVFVGYITDRKNQAFLLEILKELPENYVLQLIGKPLNPKYLEELKAYCEKNNLTNVEFLGQVEHEQIPDYLETAHVFPSASKMEVQSLVVIEALASGTPVVGLSNETIDELINDEVGAWLAKDKEPRDFAKQIMRICNLPAEDYKVMCQTARNRVAHLDWSNIVLTTSAAYWELMKTKTSITEVESDMLTGLVTFLAVGEVRDYLLKVIEEARQGEGGETGILSRVNIPQSIRSWIRVPSSTWFISGLTILASVIGYILMKGWGKKK
jgi:glycosyltransferase involved in cell wall biosynthesis